MSKKACIHIDKYLAKIRKTFSAIPYSFSYSAGLKNHFRQQLKVNEATMRLYNSMDIEKAFEFHKRFEKESLTVCAQTAETQTEYITRRLNERRAIAMCGDNPGLREVCYMDEDEIPEKINFRGNMLLAKPLRDAVKLIATQQGISIECVIDSFRYVVDKSISDKEREFNDITLY